MFDMDVRSLAWAVLFVGFLAGLSTFGVGLIFWNCFF